jgi:enoyl-CoA hydratase
VLETAGDIARRLALQAPIPLARAKHLLNQAWQLGPRRVMAREARALQECMASRDWLEGIEAFQEKRPPDFIGE